jgi:beta-lactam-binding protein with PASTA domain
MIEFENIKELKQAVKDSREKKVKELSVFSSFLRMGLFLILYAVVTAVTAFIVYQQLNRSARIVRVPSVVNRNFVDAYIALKKIDLDVHVAMQGYPDTAYGTVMAQSIPADALIKERRKIVLTVSGGIDRPVTTTNLSGEGELRSIYLVWQVPQSAVETGETEADVSVFVTDEGRYSDTLIYNQKVRPGTTLRIPLQVVGKVNERIMVNGKPVLEREVQ